jgi:hypothetical protein
MIDQESAAAHSLRRVLVGAEIRHNLEQCAARSGTGPSALGYRPFATRGHLDRHGWHPPGCRFVPRCHLQVRRSSSRACRPRTMSARHDKDPERTVIGIDCPNEDHGPFDRVDVGRMRWRPADSPNEMRNCRRYFIESVRNARSAGNRDGNGAQQRMLWHGTAPTGGQAARVGRRHDKHDARPRRQD